MANAAHGAVHDWLMGRVCDEAFPDVICFSVILTTLVTVKDGLRAEVDALAAQYAAPPVAHPVPVQYLQKDQDRDASASTV
ncbi:hypothetical protein [Sphingomonas sp.]|uniref:hypothetical protein n=1 Tax=Sphingomonas sp. TaxID=28214 RepID=UPI0037501F4C